MLIILEGIAIIILAILYITKKPKTIKASCPICEENFNKKYPTEKEIPIKNEVLLEKESKYKDWDIEYMPLADKYFPRYKNKYFILQDYPSENLQLKEEYLKMFCKYGQTEKEAMAWIDKYIEQKGITSQSIQIK